MMRNCNIDSPKGTNDELKSWVLVAKGYASAAQDRALQALGAEREAKQCLEASNRALMQAHGVLQAIAAASGSIQEACRGLDANVRSSHERIQELGASLLALQRNLQEIGEESRRAATASADKQAEAAASLIALRAELCDFIRLTACDSERIEARIAQVGEALDQSGMMVQALQAELSERCCIGDDRSRESWLSRLISMFRRTCR
jgi:hypothetical protein